MPCLNFQAVGSLINSRLSPWILRPINIIVVHLTYTHFTVLSTLEVKLFYQMLLISTVVFLLIILQCGVSPVEHYFQAKFVNCQIFHTNCLKIQWKDRERVRQGRQTGKEWTVFCPLNITLILLCLHWESADIIKFICHRSFSTHKSHSTSWNSWRLLWLWWWFLQSCIQGDCRLWTQIPQKCR